MKIKAKPLVAPICPHCHEEQNKEYWNREICHDYCGYCRCIKCGEDFEYCGQIYFETRKMEPKRVK